MLRTLLMRSDLAILEGLNPELELKLGEFRPDGPVLAHASLLRDVALVAGHAAREIVVPALGAPLATSPSASSFLSCHDANEHIRIFFSR